MTFSFNTLNEVLNDVVEATIRDCKKVTKEQRGKCGLDVRAVPYSMYYNDNMLILPKQHRGMLDYYGGFEYVDKMHVIEAGNYVIYDASVPRVGKVIDNLIDSEE